MRTLWVNLYRSPVVAYVGDAPGTSEVFPGSHISLTRADALRVAADYEDCWGDTDDYVGTVSLQVPDHG